MPSRATGAALAAASLGFWLCWALMPGVGITPTDEAVLRQTLDEDVPQVLDYLESVAPEAGFAFGAPSIADVSVATFFRNARWARFAIDAERWPRAAGWVECTLALPEFAALRPFEDLSIRTPIPKLRAALAEAGAPLTADTCFTATPRRGIMKI